jgi:hypothetical protein
MMVITKVSDRPVTEPAGTMGAVVCAAASRRRLEALPSPFARDGFSRGRAWGKGGGAVAGTP